MLVSFILRRNKSSKSLKRDLTFVLQQSKHLLNQNLIFLRQIFLGQKITYTSFVTYEFKVLEGIMQITLVGHVVMKLNSLCSCRCSTARQQQH